MKGIVHTEMDIMLFSFSVQNTSLSQQSCYANSKYAVKLFMAERKSHRFGIIYEGEMKTECSQRLIQGGQLLKKSVL